MTNFIGFRHYDCPVCKHSRIWPWPSNPEKELGNRCEKCGYSIQWVYSGYSVVFRIDKTNSCSSCGRTSRKLYGIKNGLTLCTKCLRELEKLVTLYQPREVPPTDELRNAPNGLSIFVCKKCYEQLSKSKVVTTKQEIDE